MNAAAQPFRARDLGGLVDELFRIYFRNFWPLVKLVAVAQVPPVILVSILSWQASGIGEGGFGDIASLVPLGVITVAAYLLAYVLVAGVVAYALSQYYLGQSITLDRCYAFVWRRVWTLIGASLLAGIALVALSITIIGIPFAIYFGVTWVFILIVVVMEGSGARRSLSRSAALVKNRWWRVLGILIILGLMQSVLGLVGGAVVGLGIGLFGGVLGASDFLIEQVAGIAGGLVDIIFMPIVLIGTVLLYLDLCIRKEGYTLQDLARDVGAEGPGLPFVPSG